MQWLFPVLFLLAFAFLNRARGTRLFNLTQSTFLGRLLATLGMALLAASLSLPNLIAADVSFVWTWATLLVWCTPAWDAYWSAAIGHDPSHSRLWGLAAMTLRMTLAAPCILGLAYLSAQPLHSAYAIGTLLLGLPYYLAGYLSPKNPIGMAEPAVGAILGLLLFQTLSQ